MATKQESFDMRSTQLAENQSLVSEIPIPTMETIDLSVDRLRAMLESMVEEKDPSLIDLLVANLSSFMSIMLNWKKKDLMKLLAQRILREEESLWHEEKRKKIAATQKPSREASANALMTLLRESSVQETQVKETIQVDNVSRIYESMKFWLPKIVTEGPAYVGAFRALMIGSAKRTNALLPKNGEDSGQSTTQEYLVACDQVISRVIKESYLFAEKAYNINDIRKCEASPRVFSVVKQAILGDALFAELYSFKDGLEFTPAQLAELQKDWRLLSSSDDDNSTVTTTSSSKKEEEEEKKARTELIAIRLLEIGVTDDTSCQNMARSIEKLARGGVSIDEAFRTKAVRCQIEGNLESAQIYAKAAGLEDKKLASLVAKEVAKRQELAKKQSAEAATEKSVYKPTTSFNKHQGKSKEEKPVKNKKKGQKNK